VPGDYTPTARKEFIDPLTEVADRILVVRGQRAMLDVDLARLYGVSTKAFNQAVRRNRSRFPADFLLELTNQEVARSRSQLVILKSGASTSGASQTGTR
jgi:hypothetical protein